MGRIRLVVAGDVYVNRSLVRPFLEDDGYDVVAEVLSGADVVPAVRRVQPDAIVIDDRMIHGRPGERTVERIRGAAPDAKVIVMTSAPGPLERAGADAYLPRGVSLAAVSALLGQLLGSETQAGSLAGAGVASDGRSIGGILGSRERQGPRESRGGAARFVATVAAPLLVVWGLIAVLTTGGSAPTPPASTSDVGDNIILVPQGTDSLDEAEASLAQMIDALEAGNYVLATVHAKALMGAREIARTVGYSTAVLDAQITAGIGSLAELLPVGVSESLQQILGHLFPVLPDEQSPGGGSGLIFAPVTESGGGTTPFGGGGTTTFGGGGTTTGGNGSGSEGDGAEECTIVVDEIRGSLGPGDGRAWGHSHKLMKDACDSTPVIEKEHGNEAHHEGGHGHGNDKDESRHEKDGEDPRTSTRADGRTTTNTTTTPGTTMTTTGARAGTSRTL